ncbi:hypothetical protein HWV62_31559 [Athelia sp. TMB]|nr:hypothetical protein HWV62_31559 [Athelia sp. TMB]
MPQQYRPVRQPTLRPQSQPQPPTPRSQPQLTDADESIVLSDLVRTGEASRLRRRGAMRLDHAVATGQPTQRRSAQVGMGTWEAARRDPAQWESGSDDEYTEWTQNYEAAGMLPEMEARPPEMVEAEREKDVYKHVLFCGAEVEDDGYTYGHNEPAWEPSPFPLFSEPSAASSSKTRFSSYKPIKKSNGCGALVHMHASPRRRQGVWMAKTPASDAVVAMDPSHFERKAVVKMLRSACGCVREGVGCAACGNTLGTRYKPCQAAAEGLFSHTSASRVRTPIPGPLRPEGPEYWHPSYQHPSSPSSAPHRQSSRSARAASPYHVYTFFSANVTASPQFSFPSSTSHHHHRVPSPPALVSPSSPPRIIRLPPPRAQSQAQPRFFDRMTRSPEPIWESEIPEYGRRLPVSNPDPSGAGAAVPQNQNVGFGAQVAYDNGVMLDLDGVAIPRGDGVVPTQPNSPDKLGELNSASGDSYSDVGTEFNPQEEPHPTPAEPLGVDFPGRTFAEPGHPNWLGHLISPSLGKNAERLVYCYAVGGDTVAGVEEQIKERFLPSVGKNLERLWTAEDTLFCQPGDFTSNMVKLFSAQEELYKAGARNFLFIDVPPVGRSPGSIAEPSPDPEVDARAPVIQSWNTLFAKRVQFLTSSHSQEITTLLFSSHRLFADILDHPVVYGFERGDVEKCGGGIWVDYLHPTSKIHKIIASEIVDFLDCIASHPSPPQ